MINNDESPTASAMFMVLVKEKNARLAASDVAIAVVEASSTTRLCRASIPYAWTVGAPCRTFNSACVRVPAAARSAAYREPARRRKRRSPKACTTNTVRNAHANRQSSETKPTTVKTTVTRAVKTPAVTLTEALINSTSSVIREVTSPVPACSRVAASIRSALSIADSRRSAARVNPSWSHSRLDTAVSTPVTTAAPSKSPTSCSRAG